MKLTMHLVRRDNSTDNKPKAYSVQPSGVFDKHDGNWSTFNLDVGSPPQSFRVVPSTGTSQIWLPTSEGCRNGTYNETTGQGGFFNFPANCAFTRGVGDYQGRPNSGYNPELSLSSPGGTVGAKGFVLDANADSQVDPTTWYPSTNSSYNASGLLEPDYIQFKSDSKQPLNTTSRAAVLGYSNRFFLLSTLGLVPKITNDTVNGGSFESPVLSLFHANITPSRSFGYTAGSYSDNQRLGSLTLGGYDLARINGTQSKFNIKSSTSALQVRVTSMNFLFNNGTSPTSVSSAPFDAVIDSTLPYIELPTATLQNLATITGMKYLAQFNLWYWSEMGNGTQVRQQIASTAKSLTITLGANGTGTDATPLTIELPFESMYAQTTSWVYNQSAVLWTLPIRNASTQGAVLGRAFLQEAYVFADYERAYFNVSKATRGSPAFPTLVSVYSEIYNVPGNVTIEPTPSPTVTPAPQPSLSSGAIAGIAVGSAVGALLVLALLGALLWFFLLKPRRDKKRQAALNEKNEKERMANVAAAALAKSQSADHSHRNSAWSDGTVWTSRPGFHERSSSDPSELGDSNQDMSRYRHGLPSVHEIGPMDKDDTTELAANAEHQRHYAPVEMPNNAVAYNPTTPGSAAQISPALSGAPSPGISTYRDST